MIGLEAWEEERSRSEEEKGRQDRERRKEESQKDKLMSGDEGRGGVKRREVPWSEREDKSM